MTRVLAVSTASPPHRYPQHETTGDLVRGLPPAPARGLARWPHAETGGEGRPLAVPLDRHRELSGHDLEPGDVTAGICRRGGPEILDVPAAGPGLPPAPARGLARRPHAETGGEGRPLAVSLDRRRELSVHDLEPGDVTAWICRRGGPEILDVPAAGPGLPAPETGRGTRGEPPRPGRPRRPAVRVGAADPGGHADRPAAARIGGPDARLRARHLVRARRPDLVRLP
ncbi:hypothetical protein [Streptomyces roseoviridis]|uniref:Uncharacterized protein n=1 Tax=Streptomyces roseoviridis TaxID=67361 RepID=A0ABV5QY91_9ACTN